MGVTSRRGWLHLNLLTCHGEDAHLALFPDFPLSQQERQQHQQPALIWSASRLKITSWFKNITVVTLLTNIVLIHRLTGHLSIEGNWQNVAECWNAQHIYWTLLDQVTLALTCNVKLTRVTYVKWNSLICGHTLTYILIPIFLSNALLT